MLRTRTDPKTGNHLHVKCRRPRPGTTLCGILRSRHAHHKSRFIRKFTGKKPQPRTAAHTLCEPAQSKCTSTCHKGHFIQKFPGKMPAPEPRRRLCPSLHSRHAHQHVTRAFLYNFFYEKCRGPEPRPALCASLRSRNAHQRVTNPVYTENYKKNAAAELEHPDQAPAFTLTVRIPECGHTLWGTYVFSVLKRQHAHEGGSCNKSPTIFVPVGLW